MLLTLVFHSKAAFQSNIEDPIFINEVVSEEDTAEVPCGSMGETPIAKLRYVHKSMDIHPSCLAYSLTACTFRFLYYRNSYTVLYMRDTSTTAINSLTVREGTESVDSCACPTTWR